MPSTPWTVADVPDQRGRTALVTGANAGLGFEIAAALAASGATVVLGCRNQAKAEVAAAALGRRAPGATVDIVPLDLASLDSVRAAAAAVRAGHPRLHLLANNAGVMATDAARTADGFELQFGVNHLGHFALTLELLPLLVAADGARIVTMSSMAHRVGRLHLEDLNADRRPYRRWPAYCQSKLANLAFTAELHRRLMQRHPATLTLAAHPGASTTDLGSEGSSLSNRMLAPLAVGGQSATAGAAPFLRAATDPDARGGQFYGPRWMLRGPAVLETPSRRARRAADALALWDASEALTGLRFDTVVPPS